MEQSGRQIYGRHACKTGESRAEVGNIKKADKRGSSIRQEIEKNSCQTGLA